MGNRTLEEIARRRQEEQMEDEDLFLPGGFVRCKVCRKNIVSVARRKNKQVCTTCSEKTGETSEPKSS